MPHTNSRQHHRVCNWEGATAMYPHSGCLRTYWLYLDSNLQAACLSSTEPLTTARARLLNEGLGCVVEAELNFSCQCDPSSSFCKALGQQQTLQDLYGATTPSSDSSLKSSSSTSTVLLGVMWAFLTGGVLLSCFFLIFTIRCRKNRFVKLSSPNLNIVTLLGSGFTYSSAFLFGIEKQTPGSGPSMESLVQMRISLLCIGGSLAFGPILGKSWRLYKVFTQRAPNKRVIIKDLQLLVMVTALVLADIILLLTWIFLDPVQCFQVLNASLKVMEEELPGLVNQGYFCTSLYADLWLILFWGFKGMLLIYGAYLAGLTADVSCPPINQSLTLIVGITTIFLSAGIVLAVNRFFHLWHNLIFAFTSGGIFVCTVTINGLIFIPQQVRQWRAFEKPNEDLSKMVKYLTSSSKNLHSMIYTDEDICQLIGEKNSMMQLLAEKDTAIASLQEQMNKVKEKLMRFVVTQNNYDTVGSTFPSTSQSHFAANCSSMAAGNSQRHPSSSGVVRCSLLCPTVSDLQYRAEPFNKREGTRDSLSLQSMPSETTAKYSVLKGSEKVADNSSAKDDQDKWLSNYSTTICVGTQPGALGQCPSTLSEGADQPQSRAISLMNNEVSMDYVSIPETSQSKPEHSEYHERSTLWTPLENQPDLFTEKLSPYETRREGTIPNHPPSFVGPCAWCFVNQMDSSVQGSYGGLKGPPRASEGVSKNSIQHERAPLSSSLHMKMQQYKPENWSKLPGNEDHSCLFDKCRMEHCGSSLYPSSVRNVHHQQKDFLSHRALITFPPQHFYTDSDSSSSSSGEGTQYRHRRYCEVCLHSLSSSSDSFMTDTDSLAETPLDYCTNLYGKHQPVVNFHEDLEPTYV